VANLISFLKLKTEFDYLFSLKNDSTKFRGSGKISLPLVQKSHFFGSEKGSWPLYRSMDAPDKIHHTVYISKDRENAKYKIWPCRPVRQRTKILTRNVKKFFWKNPNRSVWVAPRQLKISKTYLPKIKANKIGFKTCNTKTVPKYNEDKKRRS